MFMNDTNEAWSSAICSLFTTIYIPALVMYMSYSGNLYNMGKFSSLYFVALLFVAECVKMIYIFSKSGYGNDATSSRNLNAKKATHAVPQFKIKDALKLLMAIPASVFMFVCGIIMFGAPARLQHEETFMLAMLLTTLTTFPLFVYTGVDNTVRALSGQKLYFGEYIMEMLVQNVILTIFGTWGGAILIPLDWDRPWQAWPLPCAFGALMGYILACLITVIRMIPLAAKSISVRT